MIRPLGLGAAVVLLACDAAACIRAPVPFAVKEILPRPEQGPLRLNDEITIVFTAPIDPSSVCAQSVGFWGADAVPVEGPLEVGEDRVTFVPRPVELADWSDGGYRAGQTVDLALAAFPERTGVLSVDGAPLDAPFRARFHVVDSHATSPVAGAPPAFRDVAVGAGPVLTNRSALVAKGGDRVRVRPDGTIRLDFSEPLDPRSVTPDTIRLSFSNPGHARVPCELVLEQGRRTASVRVRPQGGFALDAPLVLDLGAPGPTDLVGTPFEGTVLLQVEPDASGPAVAGAAE